jgi:hypothetical protein
MNRQDACFTKSRWNKPKSLLRPDEQARCLFHKIKVEQASCLLRTIWKGHLARSTIKQFLVEQAGKPVPKWHNIYPEE